MQVGSTTREISLVQESTELPSMGGSLGEYLAYALRNSPDTRAAFERWRAARFRISRAARLPEPSISFGYYLRSVETRVGPQQYKIGVSQTFPWPTKLSAGKDAATEGARAAALVVDANVLAVRRKVAEAYWSLWLVNEEHRLKSEHDAVLEALAGAVRGRLQTGVASLADLNQVDLSIARHHDHRGQHEEAAQKASAGLLAVLGAHASTKVLAISDFPVTGLPTTSAAQLAKLSISRQHPHIEGPLRLAASESERARAQAADRYPRFTMGLSLIGTGEAAMAGVDESGKDALVVSVGVSLPLWAGSYSDAEQAAHAMSRSHKATAEGNLRQMEALLATALSDVQDAQRRIGLYKKTLVPQAQATFEAVLGGYQTGGSTIAAVIIAQRDLIELQIEQVKALSDHAKAWALLEFVVGQEVESTGER